MTEANYDALFNVVRYIKAKDIEAGDTIIWACGCTSIAISPATKHRILTDYVLMHVEDGELKCGAHGELSEINRRTELLMKVIKGTGQ